MLDVRATVPEVALLGVRKDVEAAAEKVREISHEFRETEERWPVEPYQVRALSVIVHAVLFSAAFGVEYTRSKRERERERERARFLAPPQNVLYLLRLFRCMVVPSRDHWCLAGTLQQVRPSSG